MTDTITSLVELLTLLDSHGIASQPDAHVRNWFRGHADRNWKLAPGVYRPNFGTISTEDERLKREQHLFQDFRVLSAGVRKGRESDAELYFLQQHYGMPTRLLDWTTNPLAAVFFAVSDEKATGDGTIYYMDAYSMARDQDAKQPDGRSFGIATAGRKYFKDGLNVIAGWGGKSEFGEWTIPIRPEHFEKRIGLQRGCFTFHVPKCSVLSSANISSLKEIAIPATAKPKLRQELALFGIDSFTIFGDLDHLAEYLKSVRCK